MELLENGYYLCEDGVARPRWACFDKQLREYYDNEWGKECRKEQEVFERLCLEGFQVGLSWKIVLSCRERLREVFADFSPDEVGRFTESKIEEILGIEGIIKNERKVRAVVQNALATIAMRNKGGISQLVWKYHQPDLSQPLHVDQIPAKTAASEKLAKELKKAGFTMVGPVNMYALMQAIGVVNDRVKESG
ncbi:DNA-3-methyladenine glycosylase I [Actinomycetaceae bacterium TAE3-ERU4]|nr:DNA-3-methyladenine glycosylase I [Actinomycetaceae bacterium TAE3-ERU4]